MTRCPICRDSVLSYGSKKCRRCMPRDTQVRRALWRTGLLVQTVARDSGLSIDTVLRAARGVPIGRGSALSLARVLKIHPSVMLVGEPEGS
jgi:tRNA(Ile2) C34 agmatinyltransferase TiaS